jgi:spoIIIJ-associated protein
MDNLEISAKTVEEATKKALTHLDVGLDEVEITVLSEGKSGILGLGAEDARISVQLKKKEENEDTQAVEIARNVLDNLLKDMGIQANINVEIQPPSFNDDEEETHQVVFNINGGDLGLLIGRRGQTLDALQYLVRLITTRQTKSKIPILVDVENYKQNRYEDLRTLALNVAAQVKLKKTSCRLEPMSPFERRIIHLTLANDPDVTTESTGEGDLRKVVVFPQNR